jgi:hypothetical protein
MIVTMPTGPKPLRLEGNEALGAKKLLHPPIRRGVNGNLQRRRRCDEHGKRLSQCEG